MRLKPAAPDGRVPMPGGGFLPAGGLNLELDTYWRKRLEDEDVVEAEAEDPAPAPAAEEAAGAAGEDAGTPRAPRAASTKKGNG